MSRKFLRISAIIGALLLAGLAGLGLYVRNLLTTSYRGYAEDRIALTIAPGTSLRSIAEDLQAHGVIRHEWVLRGIFRWKGTEGRSKAGEYVFDRPLTPLEVYDKLMKGETQYTVVTIPEGSNVFEIGAVFAGRGICTESEFREALTDPLVLSDLRAIEPLAPGPEGFLFPETYFFGKNESASGALRMMLREFSRRFGDAERRRAAELGWSALQVVTMASLVEKETGLASERSLISGVFHNRLRLGMLLQCDPTVIYALLLAGEYRGTLTRADLQKQSPYNTYASGGLPPGPICNPGADAIRAALYPLETDRLYFVARNDGSHQFSATLAEHNRAVQQYRRR